MKIRKLNIVIMLMAGMMVGGVAQGEVKESKVPPAAPKTDGDSFDDDLFKEMLGKVKDPFQSPLSQVVKSQEPVQVINRTPVMGGVGAVPFQGRPSALANDSKPFVQPAEIPPPALQVNGVIWNSDRPQAIINDRVIDVGDEIAESKVVKIRRSGVDVEYKGKVFSFDVKE